MSIDVEYAIKKDVRNNPIVRGVDERQRRALWRTIGLGVLIVGMLLFSAWQHYQIIDHGYRTQATLEALTEQEALNRRLRLEVETLRAPAVIERRAIEELGMVYPGPAEAVQVDRVVAPAVPKAVFASAREH